MLSGKCRCAPPEIARYRARISGPLLDRIDLRVEVAAVPDEELLAHEARRREASAARRAAEQVRAARDRQIERAAENSMPSSAAAETRKITAARSPVPRCCWRRRARGCKLSARGVHRVLRVARTIADLDERGEPLAPVHLAEALQLRRAISREHRKKRGPGSDLGPRSMRMPVRDYWFSSTM